MAADLHNITSPIAKATAAAPTITEGDVAGISLDLSGNLRVTGSGGGTFAVGGTYNSTLPTYTNGQNTTLQSGTRGALNVTIFAPDSTNAVQANTSAADGVLTSVVGLTTRSEGYVFNGTTWDRARGDTVGAYTVSQAGATGGASFLNIAAGQATTTVKSGAGRLYSIIFNGPAVATNTTIIYDNTAGSGTVIGRPLATAIVGPTAIEFGPTGLQFATGLTIVTASANGADMTVVYK